MRLRRLHLRNFRQFRDDTIEFASGGDRNVTVIHGANGAGKTTLLNAFTWLFYDEVDFDSRPERLVSEGAMAAASNGDTVTVSVRLDFEHEAVEYTAQRTATYEKGANTDFDGQQVDEELVLEYQDGGTTKTRQNPSNSLDQMIPQRLSELFFFDGEDIDELAGIDNQEQIQEAIQNIMGLTILERATRHLDAVAKRFEKEVQEYGSDELSGLIQEKNRIEDEIEDLEREKTDKQRARERLQVEISDVEDKLERLDESAALQERRSEYQAEISELEDDVEELNGRIKSEIDSNGFVPLAMPLIRETASDLDRLREQGTIPSGLSNSLLDSLLENNECICGRPLEAETTPYELVSSLKGDATADGVEQGAMRIIGDLQQFANDEREFFDAVDEFIERRKTKLDRIETLEEHVDEIGTELQGIDETTSDGMSVSDLENAREQKEADKESLIQQIGAIERDIESKREEITEIVAEISDKQDERNEALLAKRRQQAAEEVRTRIDDSFSGLKNKVRRWSNRMVQDTFSEIASKELTAEITDEFRLRIWQQVGDNHVEVDKSTGERQIASLAFIGSLVNIARERYESNPDSEYFTGGVYPLVMDSPFGALDKSHRRKVSQVIPTLASQVVVFATDSQWEGPVEEEMRDRVGKQYWLDFDPGQGTGQYPQTRVQTEAVVAGGD